MSNSSLVNVKVWANSSNYTKGRSGNKIKKITLHHMAGVLTAAQCGNVFKASGRGASAHYGVGSDGKIGQYVDEANTAWSDGNWTSNCTSVSIEVANSSRGGQWPVSSKSIQLTIKLVADIAKRNGLGKLTAGKNLTWHSMYAATACPGPYLKSQIKYIAQEANKILDGTATVTVAKNLYRVRKSWEDSKSQVGAFAKLPNAQKVAKKYKGYKVYDTSGKLVYDPWKTTTTTTTTPKKKTNTEIAKEIIKGTCSDSRWKTWGNGATRAERLQAAGYSYNAVQKIVNELMKK